MPKEYSVRSLAEASCARHNWRPASPAEAAVSRRGCSGSVTTPAGSNWRSLTRSSSRLATRVPGARPWSADSGSRRWYGRRRGQTGLNRPSDQRLGAWSGNESTAVREASWCRPASASPAKGGSLGLPGERSWAEAAPRHEGGHGEIDQVGDDRCPLATAEAHDHRASKQQYRAGSSQRHQNRRDAERGGHDQADRSQELEGSDGLEGTGAEVFNPSRGGAADTGQLLLGTNSFVLLATRKATARIPATIHRARFSLRFMRISLTGYRRFPLPGYPGSAGTNRVPMPFPPTPPRTHMLSIPAASVVKR